MGRKCFVIGCTSGYDSPSHQFPKNELRRQSWIDVLATDNSTHISPETISKSTICWRHFSDDSYVPYGKLRMLKATAVPTLYLANNCESSLVEVSPSETNRGNQSPVATELTSDRLQMKSTTAEKPVVEQQVNNAQETVTEHRSYILGSVTRKKKLLPEVKRVYEIAVKARKRQLELKRKIQAMKTAAAMKSRDILCTGDLGLPGLTSMQRTLIRMQIRNGENAQQGRRFTVAEKLMCLGIYKESPTGYRLLMRLFCVPSPKTLKALLAEDELKSAINPIINPTS